MQGTQGTQGTSRRGSRRRDNIKESETLVTNSDDSSRSLQDLLRTEEEAVCIPCSKQASKELTTNDLAVGVDVGKLLHDVMNNPTIGGGIERVSTVTEDSHEMV